MKTLMILSALTAALAATTTTARAEDMPKPIADLERFVGNWKAAGTMTMGKDAAKVKVSLTCKRTSAMAGVLCTMEMKGIPGLPVYAETDLFGYEPNTGTLHWFAVTNAGETHDHARTKGSLDEGKIQFAFNGTQEAKPLKEVIDFELAKDGKTMTVRGETFVGGASTSVLELKAKK